MTKIVVEYVDGTKEEIHPSFDQWQALWKSGFWKERPVATVIHNGWPVKFREVKPKQ